MKFWIRVHIMKDGFPAVYVNGANKCTLSFSHRHADTRSNVEDNPQKRNLFDDFYHGIFTNATWHGSWSEVREIISLESLHKVIPNMWYVKGEGNPQILWKTIDEKYHLSPLGEYSL